MPQKPEDNHQATRCREIADRATNEVVRNHWLKMGKYWLDRDAQADPKTDSTIARL